MLGAEVGALIPPPWPDRTLGCVTLTPGGSHSTGVCPA